VQKSIADGGSAVVQAFIFEPFTDTANRYFRLFIDINARDGLSFGPFWALKDYFVTGKVPTLHFEPYKVRL
jgi:hypothetical protein